MRSVWKRASTTCLIAGASFLLAAAADADALSFNTFKARLPARIEPARQASRGFSAYLVRPHLASAQVIEPFHASGDADFDKLTLGTLAALVKDIRAGENPEAGWLVRFDRDGTVSASEKAELPDFTAYMTEMQGKIKANWNPAKQEKERRSELSFTVKYDGTVSGVKIINPSSADDFDKEALTALEKSLPLPTLPEGSPDTVDVRFTLEYRIKAGVEPTSIRYNSTEINDLWTKAFDTQMQRFKKEQEAR